MFSKEPRLLIERLIQLVVCDISRIELCSLLSKTELFAKQSMNAYSIDTGVQQSIAITGDMTIFQHGILSQRKLIV